MGAAITLVASRSLIRPGDSVTVDAFVRGVSDLRTYQVMLTTSGGESGRLNVEDMVIDSMRADYVFAGLQKIDAVDTVNARFGGVLFNGGVEAVTPAYVGTFTLQASVDAAGSFRVSLRTADNSSLLQSSRNEAIAFSAGQAAISVAAASGLRRTDK